MDVHREIAGEISTIPKHLKKPVSLNINGDLLPRAGENPINLSEVLDCLSELKKSPEEKCHASCLWKMMKLCG
jgi:hypothetical protein